MIPILTINKLKTYTMKDINLKNISAIELSFDESVNIEGGIIVAIIVNSLCAGILLAPVAAAFIAGWHAYDK
jgi:hypothetical protein